MRLLCLSLCQSESDAPASILRCQQGTSCACLASYNCFSWKTITKPYSALTRMAIQWRHTYLCETYCWLQMQKHGWKFYNYKDIIYRRVHNENVKLSVLWHEFITEHLFCAGKHALQGAMAVWFISVSPVPQWSLINIYIYLVSDLMSKNKLFSDMGHVFLSWGWRDFLPGLVL